MNLPCTYPYNAKWGTTLAAGLFFGAGAAFLAHEASQNTAGLILNGVIELGPVGATRFYWVLAALCAGFVAAAAAALVLRVVRPQVLELGTDAMNVPGGFFQRRLSRVAYADIQDVSEVKISGQTILYVVAGGRRVAVAASLFADRASYAAVREFLDSCVTR